MPHKFLKKQRTPSPILVVKDSDSEFEISDSESFRLDTISSEVSETVELSFEQLINRRDIIKI